MRAVPAPEHEREREPGHERGDRHQPPAFCNSSSSSRCFLLTRFGTSIRTRTSTSPLPAPFSLGAPRPLMRRSLPSSVPDGNLQRDGALGRRHVDLAAERGGRVRDGHVDDQIVAAPLVDLRRLDARDDVEVARGRAAVPRLALALELDARAVLRACRDLDREALRAPLAARAVTRRARRLDDRAHAAALRARLLQREQALRGRDDARPTALRAGDRRRSGRRPCAVTGVTGELELHGHGRLHAPQRVLEREAHLHLDVVPPLSALRLLLLRAAAVEQPAEDVAEVEVAEVERRAARRGPPVRRPELVVLLALLRVGEHVVRRLHLLEPRLGRRVTRVLVRVHLAHELAVRLLQLILRRVLRHAERLVQALRHRYACCSPEEMTTRAGRTTRSPSA